MRRNSVKDILKMLRPKQWAKNLFLFIPLFFSGELFFFSKIWPLVLGFISFSLIASSIYILNDYMDMEADKRHPKKCRRPLASGCVSPSAAFIIMGCCIFTGMLIAWFVRDKFLFILGIYFFLNLGYCLGLKNISILDVFIVAAGFVLRIKAGGAIAYIGISQWLTLMVFLLALFIALGKRRDDLLLRMSSGKEMRKAIKGYNIDFLNVSLAIVSAIIIVAYLMYTLSAEVIVRLGTYRLYYTCLFVFAGLMRYLQLIYVERDSGSPTKTLYKDRFIQACLLLWMLSFYCLIYFPDIHLFD